MKKLLTSVALVVLVAASAQTTKTTVKTTSKSTAKTTTAPKKTTTTKSTTMTRTTVAPKKEAPMNTQTIYQFKVQDLEGKTFDFAELRGKKVIIVNTASQCGLTPQYADLQRIYSQFKDKNLVIVGFPANDFNGQEPGTNTEIAAFCQKNYGVTFPMMSKISVKGEQMAPIYRFLTTKALNGNSDSEVQWNFQKYLIGTDGRLQKVISPKMPVTDKDIIDWIQS